jgi:hypothetical protein
MSGIIACPACGADNMLPDGRTSMFCAYCGKPIEKKYFNDGDECLIKSKPQISERQVVYNESSKAYIASITNKPKRRADGGIEIYEYGSWNFYSDEEVEIDPGGKLSLKNRNISKFNQISQWFSDSELLTVTKLILNQNNIKSFNGIEVFGNLRELDLTSNKIDSTAIEYKGTDTAFIDTIVLKDNPIESDFKLGNISIPNNITFNIFSPCSQCGYNRTDLMLEKYGDLCRYCFEKKEKKVETTKFISELASMQAKSNQPSFLQLLAKESGADCFVATATMGSPNHPIVLELRTFRDNWILKESWGEGFVRCYYYYGGKAAKIIEKSPILKKISYLFIVKPLVFISRLLIK